MVCGASMQCLIEKDKSVLVLNEIGPAALLAAFSMAIESLSGQDDIDQQFENLHIGDHVFLGDSSVNIKAIYDGEGEISGQKILIFHYG